MSVPGERGISNKSATPHNQMSSGSANQSPVWYSGTGIQSVPGRHVSAQQPSAPHLQPAAHHQPLQQSVAQRPHTATAHGLAAAQHQKQPGVAADVSWRQSFKLSYKFAKLGCKKYFAKHKVATRVVAVFLVALLLLSIYIQVKQSKPKTQYGYISSQVSSLLSEPNDAYAEKLTLNKDGGFDYNLAGSAPGASATANSLKISASFGPSQNGQVKIKDNNTGNVSIGFKPKFAVSDPLKNKNRVIYNSYDSKALTVYTLMAGGIKEDIILESLTKDEVAFDYELALDPGTEPRMENDGSLGIYGVADVLLGQVATGTEKDAKLLENARKNGEKNKLLFKVPAPFVKEYAKKTSNIRAWFSLDKNVLTVHATGLTSAAFPLSIDPTIYIESASKLMRGNNETNVDYDPTNGLFQKSQTTGARIDGWRDSTEANSGTWGQSIAASSGYVYKAGGRVDPTMPYVVGSQSSVQATNSTSFVMTMPTVRPAGDLYVAIIGHDGTGVITPPGGGGWTEYADNDAGGGNTRELAAYYKEGTNVSGGNEAATYTWTGGSEQWTGVILRIKGFNVGAPTSGSAGRGFSSSDAVPVYPTVTPSHDATLIIRSAAVDADQPSAYGWLPLGHTALHSSESSTDTANSVALVVSTLDSPPLTSVATGTTTLTNDGLMNDSYGAASIAIRPATVTAGIQSKLEWAQINSDPTIATIDSPNPSGASGGTCSGWCNNSVYDLPGGALRRGMSMVAYNGYLYAMGGTSTDVASGGTNTVWIAKLGANGEPQLWHPTGGSPGYWFASANTLPVSLSQSSLVAYNNRMYLFGGLDTSGTSLDTVRAANINPSGDIGAWTTTGMLVLPDARHGHSVEQYNGVLYLVGGNSNGTLRNTVYYSKLDSSGNMLTWKTTNNFTTARASFGGSMTAIWGAYLYIAGGCSALTSGYCSTIASDVQLASINADGSLAEWNSILTLSNQRIGHTFVAWQGGLYRFGGCNRQNTSTGVCYATHRDTEFGIVNSSGDASTVSNSVPANTGVCSGASPVTCDLPAAGDGAQQGGQMSSMVVINNGYIYNIGGCTSIAQTSDCTTGVNTPAMSGNVAYAALDSQGRMTKPATCAGTYVTNSLWCVDSTNTLNGTTGIGAAGVAVFNNTIYVVGGTTGSDWSDGVYRVSLNNNGTLAGAWSAPQTFTALGLTGSDANARGYMYAFTRANPASASSNPGNLYMLGGCEGGTAATDGISCSGTGTDIYSTVAKCNIDTTGALNTCSTSGQLQIDADDVNASNQGLGLMAGTVYANRVYLVGGWCASTGANADAPCGSNWAGARRDTIYATINDSNNIVDSAVNEVGGSDTDTWEVATGQISPARRRGISFGYNGYIYSLAGYSTSGLLQDLLFAKINVSDGDIGTFSNSGVTVTPRWDLRAIVSNGYVYAIGGCTTSGVPPNCTGSMQAQVQTFQLYNNDSGSVPTFTASAGTFPSATDRWGITSTVLNGYVYVAGGCTSASITPCTSAENSVVYSQISATDGSLGAWSAATASLPEYRYQGYLVTVGPTLYYIGGLGGATAGSTTEQSNIYYVNPDTNGDISASWSSATKGVADTGSGAATRSRFGAAVWDNRIYIVGGQSATVNQNTVHVSPRLPNGGNIVDNWASTATFTAARYDVAVTAYANNLYLLGGDDGTSLYNDVQYASIGYKTGTISQSGTVVTGSGTSWTAAMAGSTIQYSDGSTAVIQASPTPTSTSITVDVSKTVASSSKYVIQDGSLSAWSLTTGLPSGITSGRSFASNGYMYYISGRNSSGCQSQVIVAPISANTTIATNNNPTGLGEWYETSVTYSGTARSLGGVSYYGGKMYLIGGGCNGSGPLAANRTEYATLKSQPQVAKYSRLIDTDTDVFPTGWLLNGLDNAVGSRWQVKYSSMHDIADGSSFQNPTEDCGTTVTMPLMTTLGYETNFGNTYMGDVSTYKARNGATYSSGTITQSGTTITGSGFTTDLDGGLITYLDGTIATVTYVSPTQLTSSVTKSIGTGQTYSIGGGNINCARYYYFSISIDSSQTFGYPEDVNRGPTISDISLFFTSDPSKRLRHGKTFTGGEAQPLDTPCRVTEDTDCSLP